MQNYNVHFKTFYVNTTGGVKTQVLQPSVVLILRKSIFSTWCRCLVNTDNQIKHAQVVTWAPGLGFYTTYRKIVFFILHTDTVRSLPLPVPFVDAASTMKLWAITSSTSHPS